LTGVLELLAHLDRQRFEPMLVLFEPKPIIADLEAQGIGVQVLPPRRSPPSQPRGSRPMRALARVTELLGVVGPRAASLVQVFRQERPALV